MFTHISINVPLFSYLVCSSPHGKDLTITKSVLETNTKRKIILISTQRIKGNRQLRTKQKQCSDIVEDIIKPQYYKFTPLIQVEL